MEDYFQGAGAVLRLVPVGALKNGHADNNLPDEAKAKTYRMLSAETRPPIVVENEVVKDGNHRLRDAVERGETHIWCYIVMDTIDLRQQPEFSTLMNATGKIQP